jgi:cation/acetate symporter
MGLAAGASLMPASFLFALIGLAFVLGFDGLAYGLGLMSGTALAAILVTPALARAGTASIDHFLDARFGKAVAVLGSAVLVIASGLLLLAELSLAGLVAERFMSVGRVAACITVAAFVCLLALARGRRFDTWIRAALYAVIALGLLVPLALIAADTHGLGLAHLTFGTALGDLGRVETKMLEAGTADYRVFKPHTKPFLALDQRNDLALIVSLTAGGAVLTHVLAGRLAAGPSRHAARLTQALAALFAMLLLITVPALATYAKLVVYSAIANGTPLTSLPAWLEAPSRLDLVRVHGVSTRLLEDVTSAVRGGSVDAAGVTSALKSEQAATLLAWAELKPQAKSALIEAAKASATASGVDTWALLQSAVLPAAATAAGNKTGLLTHGALAIDPAAIPIMLPLLTSRPELVAACLLASALAAVLAAASALAAELASILVRDRAAIGQSPRLSPRHVLSALVVSAVTAAAILIHPRDVVSLAVAAFSIAGAGLLPALLFGLWWRSASRWGAAAAIAAGLALTLYYLAATQVTPAMFYEAWPGLSNASDSAARKFASLSATWANAAEPQAKAQAFDALDAFALGSSSRPGIANWFGIASPSAAVFGLPLGLLVMLLVSLILPRSRQAPHDRAG